MKSYERKGQSVLTIRGMLGRRASGRLGRMTSAPEVGLLVVAVDGRGKGGTIGAAISEVVRAGKGGTVRGAGKAGAVGRSRFAGTTAILAICWSAIMADGARARGLSPSLVVLEACWWPCSAMAEFCCTKPVESARSGKLDKCGWRLPFCEIIGRFLTGK